MACHLRRAPRFSECDNCGKWSRQNTGKPGGGVCGILGCTLHHAALLACHAIPAIVCAFEPKYEQLLEEFRGKFYNISRIMDCVGCQRCRLWGKLQVMGLGTALRLLYAPDREIVKQSLQRNHVRVVVFRSCLDDRLCHVWLIAELVTSCSVCACSFLPNI